MGKIFFNSLGDFQWASVAALFALIGTIVSAIFSSLSHNNSKKNNGYSKRNEPTKNRCGYYFKIKDALDG